MDLAKRIGLYFLIALAAGGLNFAIARNVMFAVIIGVLFGGCIGVLVEHYKKNDAAKKKLYDEAKEFITLFLKEYQVSSNINGVLKQIESKISPEVKEQLQYFERKDGKEKLQGLSKYFKVEEYNIFLHYVLEEKKNQKVIEVYTYFNTRYERKDNLFAAENDGKKRSLLQCSLSWFLMYSIILIFSTVLPQLYKQLLDFKYYSLIIFISFIIMLLNFVYLITINFKSNFIKGDFDNEENSKKHFGNWFKSNKRDN